MVLLTIDALVWLGLHLGVAGTNVRYTLVRRTGVNVFRALFSISSIVALVLLVMAYNQSATVELWTAPTWLRWLLALVMLPSFVLFAGSFRGNPTAAGGEKHLSKDIRGIQRITRHPMMVAYAIWAAVHIIGSGDLASLIFFGAFLITVVVGIPSIDRKTEDRDDQAWRRLKATTSIVPFGAILAGRNKFVPVEIGWVVPAVGVALWASLLIFHRAIFGLSPLGL